MRKRGIRKQVWLNREEAARLQSLSKKAGLNQETYLRTLITGYVPKETPPADYFAMTRELHAIGVNLNQLAAAANATGRIDRAVFDYEATRLRRAVTDIQKAVLVPERSEGHVNG